MYHYLIWIFTIRRVGVGKMTNPKQNNQTVLYKMWLYSEHKGKHLEFETTNPDAFDQFTLRREGLTC